MWKKGMEFREMRGVSAGESRASCVPGVSKSVYWSRMVSKIRLKSDSRVYQSANGSVDSSCRVFPLQRDVGIGQGNVNPVLLLGLVDLGVFPAIEAAVWQSNLLTGDTGTADPGTGA